MKWREDEPSLTHLSDVIWKCPTCLAQAVRYDKEKHIFICWECCYKLTEDEGHKQLEGFKVGPQHSGYGDGHE